MRIGAPAEKRNEPCKRCSHPFDPHVLVAYEDPLDGGLLLCPECDCARTWNVTVGGEPLGERHAMPPPHVVEEYRREVFGR